ncbi:family 76 glycosyl hydrolase [Thozetella sp. PMI_491]|nr:family 76 glycosyl hydrolase [Thozetella sp. PMI_491]
MRLLVPSIWIYSTTISLAAAIEIDWSSESSIKEGAATIAYGLMKYYTGNNTGDTPGNLPDPYYWWEAGAVFGTMVDYWHYTGDASYVDVTFQAMQHQVGNDKDFMPENQTMTLGNDDQGFWAMAAMTAAEVNFKNPTDDTGAQWLALAQAAFNEWTFRWDTDHCEGGLRWQIFTFNNGYRYKNSISNGCFFNLAGRLARYTGNTTYADWADKIYDWMTLRKYIDEDYNIFDGAHYVDGDPTENCTKVDRVQWTYNAGIFLHGAAAMYNFTNGSSKWEERTRGIVNRTAEYFFDDSVMYEPPCEPNSGCKTDALSFKAYLARWMASAIQLASFTYDTLGPLLLASAKGAALQCAGSDGGYKGHPGTACGMKWTEGANWDGSNGVGQQMAALSAVMYSQVRNFRVVAPVTADTGGTSVGNPTAGHPVDDSSLRPMSPITTGSRVAAAFLTIFVLAGVIGGSAFMIMDDFKFSA